MKALDPDTVARRSSALAVVSTSLHLLYLAEFAHRRGLADPEIIVLLKRPTDRPQIERVLEKLGWKHVHWVQRTGSLQNRYIALVELFSLRDIELGREIYDYGVFADYGRSMLANVDCRRLCWLGDGTKIIYEMSQRAQRGMNRHRLHRLADPFCRILLGKRLVPSSSPEIFTPFQLETGRWEPNRFEWLRSRYDFAPDSRDLSVAYFFGSYFSEREGKPILSDEEYLGYMEQVLRYFHERGLKLVYVPHRHESDKKLEALRRMEGCTVETFSHPAEMEFYLRRQYPAHVASFFSTCLFHFKLMDICESVTSFHIDFARHDSFYAPVAEEIYRALRPALGAQSIVYLPSPQERAA